MLKNLSENTITINITRHCSLRCEHCYMEKNIRENEEIMDLKNVYKIIEDSSEYFKFKDSLEEITFDIFGGEIFTASPEYLNSIINKIKTTDFGNKRIVIKSISNLMNKNIEDYKNFLENVDLMATSYDISVKRFNSSNYEIWKKNVKFCQDNNIDLTVNVTLTKYIIDKEKEILDELFKNKIFNIHLGYFVPFLTNGESNVHLMPSFEDSSKMYINFHKYMLEKQKENIVPENFQYSPLEGMVDCIINDTLNEQSICGMLTTLNIDTNGNVGMCDGFGGTKEIPEKDIMGNIFKQNIYDITNSSKYKKYYFNVMKVHPVCVNCEFQKHCYGSCRILETYYKPTDKECFGFKKFWEYTKEYTEKIKIK
jgi:radical SAM protein with 4Fe4S-binding SPASM domain